MTHSREKMLGRKLENVQAGREERLPKISAALEPLRAALGQHQWLGGATPNYADYGIMGGILFTASVCQTPVIANDDPLRDWVERCLNLYGGLGRHPGLFPLFGLEQREGDPDLFNRNAGQGGIYKRNTGPASTAADTQRITAGMKQQGA